MFRTKQARLFSTYHSKIAVIGAGAGGHSFTANVLKYSKGVVNAQDITIFDPSQMHYYQPSYTMIGGGLLGNVAQAAKKEGTYTVRSQAEMLNYHKGLNWVQQSVTGFEPKNNSIKLDNGDVYTYDYLVVNPGLQLRFDLVKGLQEALDDQNAPISTIYTIAGAYKTCVMRDNFKGGKTLFSTSHTPIKCGGAPLKIMFLCEDTFRQNKVRDNTEVLFYGASPVYFPPCKKYNDALVPIVESKGIKSHFNQTLVAVDKDKRVAQFKDQAGSISDVNFDFMHFVPPQSAPEFIRTSELAAANGWLDVDKNTLQHSKFKNIFGMGDAANLPTGKTAAAIFSQTPVLIKNLLKEMGEKRAQSIYEGYASCPMFVGGGKLMLIEFKYDGVSNESFFSDQTTPRRSFYYLKKEVFPRAYFSLMPKGKWHGKELFYPADKQ